MTDVYDTAATVSAVRAAAAMIAGHKAELTRLDQAIGDGDHGENLARGFHAVLVKLESAAPATPADALKLVATTLISTVGGASGPLYGTAFLRASTALAGAAELTPELVAAALAAARDGVVARGKAEPGDKTMVDALGPAAEAARAAADGGGGVREVLAAAADAAARGSEATVPLQARKGRASYLGERSVGHVDPGSRSTAYLLASFAAGATGAADDSDRS
ncbi:dihydroxyacetone kinase subunit DhaL [Nakamurella endophytica]|uniref:Dihydroxyacetone kinase subunit L n=1 Tax=Nakamurella endophytica TaxID=1748367 RepID=A0A917WJB5_9ACTN|nr:dihydroxyacetone kinase subunit DhaL [Nakamurella endophytica]GGM07664.1 dihydroxyacetone kinase subunit L [Nakamurella endophytica]